MRMMNGVQPGGGVHCNATGGPAVLISGVEQRLGPFEIHHRLDRDLKIARAEMADSAHIARETGFQRDRIGIAVGVVVRRGI